MSAKLVQQGLSWPLTYGDTHSSCRRQNHNFDFGCTFSPAHFLSYHSRQQSQHMANAPDSSLEHPLHNHIPFFSKCFTELLTAIHASFVKYRMTFSNVTFSLSVTLFGIWCQGSRSVISTSCSPLMTAGSITGLTSQPMITAITPVGHGSGGAFPLDY